MRRTRTFAIASAVVVLTVLVAASPARASITTRTGALGAGYKNTPLGGVTSARSKFRVPAITCARDTDFEVLYLGVTALNEQGERTSSAIVYAACNHSLTPDYSGVAWTADGGFQELGVAVGDTVVAKLDENGVTTKATFNNLSAGTSVHSSTASAKDPSVLIGDFGDPVIPTFDRIRMGQAQVNGNPIADNATPVTRERFMSNGSLQVGTGTIDPGDQKFVLFFKGND